jgi:polyribonucleotide nucleotidyltransferase
MRSPPKSKIGKIYEGTVLKIARFRCHRQRAAGQGWSAAHLPDRQERVNKVEDYLKEGQVVRVKVLETDDRGRVKLSMKALQPKRALLQ